MRPLVERARRARRIVGEELVTIDLVLADLRGLPPMVTEQDLEDPVRRLQQAADGLSEVVATLE